MKLLIILNILFASPTVAEKLSPDVIIKESVINLQEITKILTSIKDKGSAKVELPKLKKLFAETEKIKSNWSLVMETLEKLGQDKNKEKLQAFAKKMQPLTLAYGQLTQEKQRVLQLKDSDKIKKLIYSKEWLEGYMKYIFHYK